MGSIAWKQLLLNALESNTHLKHVSYMQLATVGTNGKPSNRTVVFRGFQDNTDNILINTDTRTHWRAQALLLCWDMLVFHRFLGAVPDRRACRYHRWDEYWSAKTSAKRKILVCQFHEIKVTIFVAQPWTSLSKWTSTGRNNVGSFYRSSWCFLSSNSRTRSGWLLESKE